MSAPGGQRAWSDAPPPTVRNATNPSVSAPRSGSRGGRTRRRSPRARGAARALPRAGTGARRRGGLGSRRPGGRPPVPLWPCVVGVRPAVMMPADQERPLRLPGAHVAHEPGAEREEQAEPFVPGAPARDAHAPGREEDRADPECRAPADRDESVLGPAGRGLRLEADAAMDAGQGATRWSAPTTTAPRPATSARSPRRSWPSSEQVDSEVGGENAWHRPRRCLAVGLRSG
jgi:hypothetical protein